jgi:hypothetical protein
MDRRERMMGIAEKLPKVGQVSTTARRLATPRRRVAPAGR